MIALLAAAAWAGDAPKGPEADIALLVQPIYGFTVPGVAEKGALPMAQLDIEVRQGEKGGISVLGGFGNVNNLIAWDVGLNGRGYLFGDFDRGIGLGGQALYYHTARRQDAHAASLFGFGPVVVLKYSFAWGLTADVDGGVAMGMDATSFDDIHSGAYPILNTAIGWSL